MDKPIFVIEYGGATTTRIGEVDITEFPPGAKITEYASEAFSWAPYALDNEEIIDEFGELI